MAFTSELFLLSAALFVLITTQDIRLPPSITLGPEKVVIYPDTVNVSLTCQAVGYPAPTFAWLKNGAALSESGVVFTDPNAGSIKIIKATKDHEGDYQCLAMNPYGQTMTNLTLLRMATLGKFDANTPMNYSVKANDKLRVTCRPPESIPSADPFWSYNSTRFPYQTKVTLSKNVQIDFNGDLCFASVASDEPADRLYRCNVDNSVIRTTNYGEHSRIKVSGSISGAAPELFFSSPPRVVALRSQQTILRCFFSGRDNSGEGTISYSWTYNGQPILPTGWFIRDATDAMSPSSGTDSSDAGLFMCIGRNSLGQANTTIELVVEAIPDFGIPENQPHDMNVTEGSTVTIKCQTDAIPTADIQWFKNRIGFDQNSLPPKFALSSDRMTLTISNVCKNCSDGTSDLMSIQCNASNKHGYSFAQGYFNVLLATKITTEPVTVTWAPHKNYKFDCVVTCDDSTDCTRQWTFEDRPVLVEDGRLSIDAEGSLHIVTMNDTDGGSSRIGTYWCIVTNSYSESMIDATIVGVPTVATAELWWVGLLVALLILLLLLLVLLCCFFCFCRDGKSYPVDKYEKKNGNDPVKELRVTGFQHFVQTTSPSTPVTFENHMYVTESPTTNTFYVEDPVTDYFIASVPPPSHLQPSPAAAAATGNYYVANVDIPKTRLSHSSQGEVFTVTAPDLWHPHDGQPYTEV